MCFASCYTSRHVYGIAVITDTSFSYLDKEQDNNLGEGHLNDPLGYIAQSEPLWHINLWAFLGMFRSIQAHFVEPITLKALENPCSTQHIHMLSLL
jgi:hypothetical protein